MNKPVLKWTPAVPIRAKDNLISSAAREKNQTSFTPTYESEPKQYMNFLMSNEYMKLWYKERGKYEKDIYSREQTIKEESKIKRRVVQRMMTYRRPLKNDFIDDYIQKKKGKEEGTEPAIRIDKMKFKPDCRVKKGDKKATDEAKSQLQSKGPKRTEEAKATKEETKVAKETKGGKETKTGKEIKGSKETKTTKDVKTAKGTKHTKEYSETRKTANAKGAKEDDDCDDVGEEVLLVCLDNQNDESCKCESNTD